MSEQKKKYYSKTAIKRCIKRRKVAACHDCLWFEWCKKNKSEEYVV